MKLSVVAPTMPMSVCDIVRRRTTLNTTPYHTTPAGCRMPAHNRPNIRVSSPRTAKVPLSQDARQAKLEHLAPPRQPLARRALGATGADRSTAGGSDRLPRGARPRGILADKPRLSRCPQAERAALFRRRGARQGTDRNVAAVRTALPRVFHQHDHARVARRVGAGRKYRQSGGAHLLALAAHLESLRCVQARLERCRHVPDDRCSLRRGGTLLYPRERCRRYRLRVHWPLYPRGPEPCH